MTKMHLAIGINYEGTNSELQGCLNDAEDWHVALEERGFEGHSLLEGNATRDAILGTMAKFVNDLKSHDLLVVTYSGHGTWVPDISGDEPDGRDEAWCPVDIFTTGQVITDDELYDIYTTRKRGSRVVVITDSCFSGGFARFADPLRPEEVPYSRPRFMPPEEWGGMGLRGTQRMAEAQPMRKRMATGALVFSGCKPEEFCYDAYINGRWNGSYTVAALRALRENGLSEHDDYNDYNDWQGYIRDLLPSHDYPQQHPVLDGTRWQKSWTLLEPDE